MKMKIMQNESLKAGAFFVSSGPQIDKLHPVCFCLNKLRTLVSSDFLPPVFFKMQKSKQYLN